jgi:VanZ family protein
MFQNTERWLPILLRATTLCCIIVLAALALLPSGVMTRTTLGGHAEHFVAYMGTALMMGFAFRKSPPLGVQWGLLIMYAALLEAGQLYSPGRHASFHDLAFSSAGVVMGGLFVWIVSRPKALCQMTERRKPRPWPISWSAGRP